MAKLIGLQAGHQNISTNCNLGLRPGTGAPGEVEFTVRVRDRLKDILLTKKNTDGTPAFQVQVDDANANCTPNTTGKDFAFYLAIHYEADIHGKGGGMISAPDPSADAVNPESRRIADCIRKAYYVPYTNDTGIQEQPTWVSNNMTFYYMWSALSAKTPCALIECGVGQNAHDKVILADTDRVANAIAKGICIAFNVPWAVTPPVDPCANIKKELETANKTITNQKTQITALQEQVSTLQGRIKTIHDMSA